MSPVANSAPCVSPSLPAGGSTPKPQRLMLAGGDLQSWMCGGCGADTFLCFICGCRFLSDVGHASSSSPPLCLKEDRSQSKAPVLQPLL